MKFGLIGDGKQARFHKTAIEYVGGDLVWIDDPVKGLCRTGEWVNFAVICSPSQFHRPQAKGLLGKLASQVIVEKPFCLPWEPLVDDDRINVVLQLRYLPLPKKAEKVYVRMVRDETYFQTWKGDPKNTGGVFFNLFIHYIDLAILLGADFEGLVIDIGEQVRKIDDLDILHIDMQGCYNRMYEAILEGKGTKPAELFYLHYIMEKVSKENGFGKNLIGKTVFILNRLF